MSIARKLAAGGAAAAVVAGMGVGVGASSASAATDPDLQRLYGALAYPGGQAAVNNAVTYGDKLDAASKKAYDNWVRQGAAYKKAYAKYQVALRNYKRWLPIWKAFHRKPPPPPKAPKAPSKIKPVVTNWALFGRIGTVSAVKKPTKGPVTVTVTGIEMAINGTSTVTFTFDDKSSLHSVILRDKPTATKPVNLVKTNKLDIKVGDKLGVMGTRWGNSALGGLVVVKTL